MIIIKTILVGFKLKDFMCHWNFCLQGGRVNQLHMCYNVTTRRQLVLTAVTQHTMYVGNFMQMHLTNFHTRDGWLPYEGGEEAKSE